MLLNFSMEIFYVKVSLGDLGAFSLQSIFHTSVLISFDFCQTFTTIGPLPQAAGFGVACQC